MLVSFRGLIILSTLTLVFSANSYAENRAPSKEFEQILSQLVNLAPRSAEAARRNTNSLNAPAREKMWGTQEQILSKISEIFGGSAQPVDARAAFGAERARAFDDNYSAGGGQFDQLLNKLKSIAPQAFGNSEAAPFDAANIDLGGK